MLCFALSPTARHALVQGRIACISHGGVALHILNTYVPQNARLGDACRAHCEQLPRTKDPSLLLEIPDFEANFTERRMLLGLMFLVKDGLPLAMRRTMSGFFFWTRLPQWRTRFFFCTHVAWTTPLVGTESMNSHVYCQFLLASSHFAWAKSRMVYCERSAKISDFFKSLFCHSKCRNKNTRGKVFFSSARVKD